MRLKGRLTKEIRIIPTVRKGLTRNTAKDWDYLCKKDEKRYRGTYSAQQIQSFHACGFLCSTVENFGITDVSNSEYISDLDYMALRPFNSSFEKWITDMITAERVLWRDADVFRKNYFSIIKRDEKTLILPAGAADTPCTLEDVQECLREHGTLELCPSFWGSDGEKYLLALEKEHFTINGETADIEALSALLDRLDALYVIADVVSLDYGMLNGVRYDHSIRLWIANDQAEEPVILAGELTLYSVSAADSGSVKQSVRIDVQTGTFTLDNMTHTLPGWEAVLAKVQKIAQTIRQISHFSMTIALTGDAPFTIVRFSVNPPRPSVPCGRVLEDYLKARLEEKHIKPQTATGALFRAGRLKVKYSALRRIGRKGTREYMQELWVKAVLDDALHTKGIPLHKKIWAWKRGFLSFRIWQYGLNGENYRDYLSDYDYYWLNRINNDYQKWVNDKTTYRLVLEPLKNYLPEYYFSVYKRRGEMVVGRMPDCPADVPESFEGVLQMLHLKGKLAFKASAGTHGDGFYCLSYADGTYQVNGKPCDEAEMIRTLSSQKSFYIVTDYLVMHEQLRKIYDKSVNTIRVMMVNEHGYDPKILQTYMRIGSSRTGFTDNVGYGGICAMVDKDTGRVYLPQTIKDHVFYDCPVHPDTKTEIACDLPYWEEVRKAVLQISRYFKELEYLGFDVAITDQGVKIIEINIHQDLHKVADHTDEMKAFYMCKIENKKRKLGI